MSENIVEIKLRKYIEQLENGEISPNLTFKEDGKEITHLEWALDHSVKPEIIKKMVNSGCDVDFPIASYVAYWTPLMTALRNSHHGFGLIEFLLKKHKPSKNDFHLVYQCMSSKYYTEILKSNNINFNASNEKGETALHKFSMHDGSQFVLEKIIQSRFSVKDKIIAAKDKFDFNIVDNNGLSPLALAINNSCHNIIPLFIETNALIYGKIKNPTHLVDYDLVERYQGDFLKDYPEVVYYAREHNMMQTLFSKKNKGWLYF